MFVRAKMKRVSSTCFRQCEWEINQTVRELDLFMEHYVFEQVRFALAPTNMNKTNM